MRVRRDVFVDAERSPRFLRLRSLTLAVEGPDGACTGEGTWDFIERPAGLDAVVVVVYRRTPTGIEVLLRRGLRVPIAVGRPEQPHGPGRHPAVFVDELVAGLIEPGETDEAARRERARVEVAEETGVQLAPGSVEPLGAPLWATPGLCAEMVHYYAADATGATIGVAHGDGSPFESLAEVSWVPLDEALRRIGEVVGDLRAELGLRRLRDRLT